MALAETIKSLHCLLDQIKDDLLKAAEKGNKAASQRVRTGTIRLEKIAKHYRKESVKAEKGQKGRKKAAKKAAPKKKAAAKKPAAKKAAKRPAAKKAAKKTTAKRATPKARTLARARALSFKRPNQKQASRRARAR